MKTLFVVGDSISMHYGPYLKEMCGSSFVYGRKGDSNNPYSNKHIFPGANGGDSSSVLAYLEEKRNMKHFYDILLINCGLHDIKQKKYTNICQIEEDTYKANCEKIIQTARHIAKRALRITTTHFDEIRHNTINTEHNRFQKDNKRYHEIALDVMKRNRIETIDLRTFTASFGKNRRSDHVHFDHEVREAQANFILSYLTRPSSTS